MLFYAFRIVHSVHCALCVWQAQFGGKINDISLSISVKYAPYV